MYLNLSRKMSSFIVPKHITGVMLVSDWNEKINGKAIQRIYIALKTKLLLVFDIFYIYLPNLIVIKMGQTILQYQRIDYLKPTVEV